MNTPKILENIKNIGVNKISEQNPAGIDARYEDLYATLQEELNKLGSATAGGAISWKNVAETCIKILQTLSKDIPAACYLPIALAYENNETDKNAGFQLWLAASKELLNLLQTFWDTAFPAKKRIKGRTNALQWWLDRSKLLLESEPFLATEISESIFNDASNLISNLDNFFAENLADNDIPLYELKQLIKRIPVKVEAEKVEEVSKIEPEKNIDENSKKESETNAEINVKNNVDETKKIAEVNTEVSKEVNKEISKTENTKNTENTPKVIEKPPTQTVNLDVANLPDLSVNVDTKAIQNALKQISSSIINLFIDDKNEVLPNDIFLWKILYCSLWGNINKLPPCSDNKNTTFLPEPDKDFMQRLAKMVDSQKYSLAIKQILGNIYLSAFLFDLHYYLTFCLKQLGEQYFAVVSTIEFEFYNLLNRAKNIEELCFENKTPFANNKTKLWITQIKKSFQNNNSTNDDSSGANGSNNIFETLNNQSDKLVAENKLSDALTLLDNQSLQYKITNPKLFLSLKLKQLELLSENNFLDLSMLLSQNLEQFCIHNKIQYWQPNLWIKFWKITYTITQKMLDNNYNDNNNLIAKEFNQKAITNIINSSVAEAVKTKN